MEREARSLANVCGVSHVMIKPCEPEEILRLVDLALTAAVAPVAQPADPAFDREHLRLLTDKLANKVNELEVTNQRLSALTDLNLQLASEHDPYVLLDKVCRGARDLLGARGAVLAVKVKNGSESIHLTTWGLAEDQSGPLHLQPGFDAGLPGRVMASGRAKRFVNPTGNAEAADLAGWLPAVEQWPDRARAVAASHVPTSWRSRSSNASAPRRNCAKRMTAWSSGSRCARPNCER